ncbi:HalOD1 output domain-containing protein [Halobacterium rubrum]|uniref:HalOD1 output domain-containing protein n=1 Tax=Halobacterium TaxID=2239 RepID=UPI001F1AA17A|nr:MULTISPECIES: HalOD1 output domain-containing protein [Halobacterium]MDH5021580.1 hypothetical protein [Halobacterium rubrum]
MGDSKENRIVRRELDPDGPAPGEQVGEIVASLAEGDVENAPVADHQIDDVLSPVFSDPPAPDAQVEISFTYGPYRVTVEQNGRARFVEV